jgi:ABC-2 type transport system permease protein
MTATTAPIAVSPSVPISHPSNLHGFAVLVARRIRVTTKTASGVIGQLASPILWVLVVAPALASSRGEFNPGVDYFTFLAVGQVAFLIPFTAMFNGINVIVDRQFGVLPEILVAPIRRSLIPLANAVAVLLITMVQVALIVVLGRLRGAHFHTSIARLPWFVVASVLLCLIVYGIAETLALKINRQEAYGPLIPAIGVTPYFLAGALYPLSVLPAGLQQAAYALPWTHAIALMRYGLMEQNPSGLLDIWGVSSEAFAAVLSLAVLVAMAAASLAFASRVFVRAITS